MPPEAALLTEALRLAGAKARFDHAMRSEIEIEEPHSQGSTQGPACTMRKYMHSRHDLR